MVMHLVDIAALRARRLHHEADALEAVTAGSDVGPLPAGHSAGQTGGEHSASTAVHESRSSGAGTAGASRKDSNRVGGSGGAGAAEAAHGGAGSPEAGGGVGDQEGGQAEVATTHEPVAGLDAQPDTLAGQGEHIASHTQRQAFRLASADAQDSEISRRSEALLPPELRAIARHPEPLFDITKAGRATRIAALDGATPDWAREEVIIARHTTAQEESRASPEQESALESGRFKLREPSEASTSAAFLASRLASRPDPVLESDFASTSARLHDSDRERYPPEPAPRPPAMGYGWR